MAEEQRALQFRFGDSRIEEWTEDVPFQILSDHSHTKLRLQEITETSSNDSDVPKCLAVFFLLQNIGSNTPPLAAIKMIE